VLIAYNDQCWIVDCEKKIKLPKKKSGSNYRTYRIFENRNKRNQTCYIL